MNLSKTLHSRIYEALDQLQAKMISGNAAIPAPEDIADPLSRAAQKPVMDVVGRHTQIWWRTYGTEFTLKGLGVMLANIATLGLAAQLNHPAALVFPTGMFTISCIAAYRWVKRNERTVAPEELRNLLPALELNVVERAYCDAILEVSEHPALDRQNAQEIADQLNELLTNSVELDGQRALLIRALGNIRATAELERERELLEHKLTGTLDPVAREALQQSLHLCENRLYNRRSLDPLLQRLDAQQEMIRQSLMNVGESLARLRVAPHTVHNPDIDAIKRSVVDINRQANSVEEAVQEVLALRSSS
jgi:hypothetical protein